MTKSLNYINKCGSTTGKNRRCKKYISVRNNPNKFKLCSTHLMTKQVKFDGIDLTKDAFLQTIEQEIIDLTKDDAMTQTVGWEIIDLTKDDSIDNDVVPETPTNSVDDFEYGICCFCGDGCNPASQSCGQCARSMWHF